MASVLGIGTRAAVLDGLHRLTDASGTTSDVVVGGAHPPAVTTTGDGTVTMGRSADIVIAGARLDRRRLTIDVAEIVVVRERWRWRLR